MKKILLMLGLVSAELGAMQPLTLSCSAGVDNRDSERAYQVNFFVNALYWKPVEEGLDYVVRNGSGAVYVNNGSVERAAFDAHGGFRVGVGYADTCRPVGASIYYTRFTSQGDKQIATQYPSVLFPVWSNPSTNVVYEQEARAHVSLSLNMCDAELNTIFCADSSVKVMPTVGLRYVSLGQKFSINTNGGRSRGPVVLVEDDAISMKSKFQGFGPKCSAKTTWGSWCGISAFGSFEFCLLYGKFNISQKEEIIFADADPVQTFLNIPDYNFHITRPTAGCIVGLQWEYAADCYDIAIGLGWENQYFFGQNQWMRFVDDINPGINIPVRGDLAMQGLTASFNIAF